MIKIIKATYLNDYTITLEFSDGKCVNYDFSYIVNKEGILAQPLKDKNYFKTFFLELGAICWKNGLELSPHSIYSKAKNTAALHNIDDVA